ncbi:MAG: DUF898 domain-containing protein [Sinobacteraceae bacterium]|nr:DUF898 domain-containing protein [Nevskiaceae bacterium]
MSEVSGATGSQPAYSARTPQQLHFTGTGGEYFRIWIVNTLLTIVTLGIYSAWAKVRRLQYFYRHTELAGSSFDFHGSAVRILVGRGVALILLVLYRYSVRMHSPLTIVILVGFALILPWLLRNSFRFRLYNASWRGTRFHFRGSLAGAYRVFLLNGFLSIITLYVLAPFMHQRLKAYQHGNSWFGQTRFSFHARAGQFYLIYLMTLAIVLAFLILLAMAGAGSALSAIFQAQKHGGPIDPRVVMRAVLLLYGGFLLMLVSIGPTLRVLIANLVWSNTRLGEHRLECHMSALRFIWINFSNVILVVLTLGLYIPWAMVRVARYQAESVRLLPASDLQEFVDAAPESPGAVGEEAASLFDFDIAL